MIQRLLGIKMTPPPELSSFSRNPEVQPGHQAEIGKRRTSQYAQRLSRKVFLGLFNYSAINFSSFGAFVVLDSVSSSKVETL